MKIVITNNDILKEKIISISNPKISFEFNDYLDFFVFEFNDNKISLIKKDYYEILTTNIKIENLIMYSKLIVKSNLDSTIYKIYILPEYDSNYVEYSINSNEIIFGKESLNNCNILFNPVDKSFNNIIISYEEDAIKVINNDLYDIYINGKFNKKSEFYVSNGDIIFIDGYLFLLNGKNILCCNVNNNLVFDKSIFLKKEKSNVDLSKYMDIKTTNIISGLYKNSPVIKKKIIKKSFNIDPPTSVELKEGNPLILTMLPMVLMSSTSIFMSINIINNVKAGKSTWADNSISLIFSGVMILTMIVYPIIQNAYKKHKESKREILRIEEYKDYIYEKKRKILEEINLQRDILNNNFKTTSDCFDLIVNNTEFIWDKKYGDDDFLKVSLGKGRVLPDISVNYPEERFTIDWDKLRIQLVRLKDSVSYIEDCPIILDLYNINNVSFISERELLYKYIESFLVRLYASHSFDDVKICVFSNKKNSAFWEKFYSLPYFWDNDYKVRFIGYDYSTTSNIVNYLDSIYKSKKNNQESDKTNYIIILDNYKNIKDIVFLNEIISSTENYGFTTIFLTDSITSLPSECKNFIYLNNNVSKAIIKGNNYEEMQFVPDYLEKNFNNIYMKLSSIYANNSNKKFLPSKVTFLQMYKTEGVDSLNVMDNWNNNSTLDNMSVPIGINEYGSFINLDLHENAHGPHGLVAGMTGSGKSELLISFILSLSINYSPKDVQFVLIDYKGGGLSNTFYSNEYNKRLPHIVGVITNISESEINRCLISLESEVNKRQKFFSDASLKYNEGNIDIYKYQQLAKKDKSLPYLSHLIIISDEFAELKTQNPEFIDKLISFSRIGRSLGIHLILCTQKPSGVVDSQIWSNSKFKICLKVQDKSDSREVIGVDDAVYLTNPGSFYLQIGYNELFMKGQSAYSNAPYFIDAKLSVLNNYKLEFINDGGKVYFEYSPIEVSKGDISGTHVTNIVKHLISLSVENNIYSDIKYLWRDSLEKEILLDKLLDKYDYSINNNLELVLGECDQIDKQRKDLVRFDLLNGNIIAYGNNGSGISDLIQTSLYFLTSHYNANTINIYVMDFSLENLKLFNALPQIGDVMYLYDKDKIVNTFKYINTIINNRKNLLSNYNSDFYKYNAENSDKLPLIFISISNLERFFENFQDLEDIFMDITRDCNKFGICFMVTVSGINSVRNKLIQGFKQVIALELKDKYDYVTLFNDKINYNLEHILGRGFIKQDGIYEMQTAFITLNDNLNDVIDNMVLNIVDNSLKTPIIPILPNVVTFDILKKYFVNNKLIPFGINRDSLEVEKVDFDKRNSYIITSLNIDLLDIFIKNFVKNISSFSNNRVYVFTDENDFDNSNINVIENNYTNYFQQLLDFVAKADRNIEFYIIFKSFNKILESIKPIPQSDIMLKRLFDILSKYDNFNIILVDNVNEIKKYNYTEIYTSYFDTNNGIFVGDGLNEQYVLKTTSIPRNMRELPDDSYGYVIDNRKIKLVKLMRYDDE